MLVGQTPRTRGRRHAERLMRDADPVRAVLAEGYLCHLGYVRHGEPRMVATGYALAGDRLYLHGSARAGWVREVSDGRPVCLAVTLLDGLVLAASMLNHSMNYRSVVLFGSLRPVVDRTEQVAALVSVVEHVLPGRSADLPPPTDKDLVQTAVLAMPLSEASGKARAGGPVDEAALPWTGVLPVRYRYGPAQPADPCAGRPVPGYLRRYRRPTTPRSVA